MSETLSTFLVTLFLLLADGQCRGGSSLLSGSVDSTTTSRPCDPGNSWLPPAWAVAAGCVLGLCVLCRPAVWAFAGVLGVWWLRRCRRRATDGDRARWDRGSIFTFGISAGAMIVTVSPWLVRNMIVIGRPILTTTHGGYTLLLGNNPVFYREVVAKPWGTVWDDAAPAATQTAWYRSVQEQIGTELGDGAGEIDRDRWMYGRAWRNIRAEPVHFMQACGLRLRRFWNVVPLGSAATSLSRPLRWGILGFYVLISIGCALGLHRFLRGRPAVWMPAVLLIAALTVVHLFFWANMRMRAPLIPAIALLSVYGSRGIGRSGSAIGPSREA